MTEHTVPMRTDLAVPLDLLAPVGLMILADAHQEAPAASMRLHHTSDGMPEHLVDLGGIAVDELPGILREWATRTIHELDVGIEHWRKIELGYDPERDKKGKKAYPSPTPDGNHLTKSSKLFVLTDAVLGPVTLPKKPDAAGAAVAARVEDERQAREIWAQAVAWREDMSATVNAPALGALFALGRAYYWRTEGGGGPVYMPAEATSWWGRHGNLKQRIKEIQLHAAALLDLPADADILDGLLGTAEHLVIENNSRLPRASGLSDYADTTRTLCALVALAHLPVFSRAGRRPVAANIERTPGEQNFHAGLPIFSGQPVSSATVRTVLATDAPFTAVRPGLPASTTARARERLLPYGVRMGTYITAERGPGQSPNGWWPRGEVVSF